ncbi:hypothetical protein EJB05_09066, partial [Eragrostis curvula]
RMASAFKKTASRSMTKAVQGTHVFEVVGYSLKRGIGVDKYVQSRTFTVGGYDWAIRFYPDGLKSSEEYVAVHLELISNNAENVGYSEASCSLVDFLALSPPPPPSSIVSSAVLFTGRSMSAESKKTASRCTTETETGGHTFEIVGYSFKKGMGVGRSIRSATFAVGGYDWAIRFYPDGSTEASKDYATAFLELVSKNAEVRARYNIRFVSQPSVQMVPVPMGGPPLHQMQMMRNQMVGTIGRVPVGPRLFKSSDSTRFGSQNSAHMLRNSFV